MEIDEILATVIIKEFEVGLAPSRVVLYGQNYNSPKDDGLYIVISTKVTDIVASTNKFDESTNEEVKSIVAFYNMTIELTSKDRTAYERKEEAVMALTSAFSVQQQELHSCKFFRKGKIQDLTFIEASSSLYRFNVNVVASHLKTKRTAIDYYEHYRVNEYKFDKQ